MEPASPYHIFIEEVSKLAKNVVAVIKLQIPAGKAQVQAIAEQKMPDLNAASVEAAMRMVEGTARSMGITVAD